MTAPARRRLLGLPVVASPAAAGASASFRWAFFKESDLRFVGAAVDRLIPRDDFPSATEAGVVVYIDRQLAGSYGRGDRMYLAGPISRGAPQQGYQLGLAPAQLYRRALDGLMTLPEGRTFDARSADEQDAFLKRLEAGGLVLNGVPSAVFFETLLANAVEGYFADPMYGGNRDMAGWRMIGFPGAYANFVQWVGRHNVRFNRPPIGIASVGPSRHGDGHSH